jgi:hypothetical protein
MLKNHFDIAEFRWSACLRQEENVAAGCSKWPSSAAAASEEARRTLAVR